MSTVTPPTFEQLARVLEEKFGVPGDRISPETVLEDVELDSLALIEVALTVQKQFGVHIPTDDLKSSGTVADLHQVVVAAAGGA